MINKFKHGINSSIRTRLILVYVLLIGIVFIVNAFVYNLINRSIENIDSAYSSNISTNELADMLENVQTNVYEYLSTRSEDALVNYYKCQDEYRGMLEGLWNENVDNDILMLQKNIRAMSESYLNITEKTIQEKRGRNVEKFKEDYKRGTDIYNYINQYISLLNNCQFRENSENYVVMTKMLQISEMISVVIISMVAIMSLFIIMILVRNMTGPLIKLSDTAGEIAAGNLNTTLPQINSEDEIGKVTKAFNAMVISLRHYVKQIRVKMENERRMKEQQLLMETHLKDAQLKYLQAQINPHFLFNCLNAGAQLAMMEDAEQTSIFVQKMADYFRYNVKKMENNTTLLEEIESVDNYIYILNVRYAGDILYEKEIDAYIDDVFIPSMILQPLVENAVNHGIKNLEENKRIKLYVGISDEGLIIEVSDNGEGIEPEKISKIMDNIEKGESSEGNSTGIGLGNVVSRLELYYKRKDLFKIESDGYMKGTKVTIIIPDNIDEDRKD